MPAMNLAARLLRRAYGMFTRVFPRCSVISQAIAFNLFLAFFPALLIAVALATSRIGGRTSLFDLIADLTQFLPPGSQAIVSEFLVKRGPEAWKVAAVGWTGTVLAGAQVRKLAMLALTVIYRVARPREDSMRKVLPGAMVATLLWWLVDVLFGIYVRRVPYSVVYGGLAAVIGLIIWMQLSAVIIFLGAAWNAELAESRKEAQIHA